MNTNDLAHEIWSAAQLAPSEGIEDGVARVAALLDEARNQDDALIRHLVDALEYHADQTRPIARTEEAIAAGLARLKGKQ